MVERNIVIIGYVYTNFSDSFIDKNNQEVLMIRSTR